MSINFNRAWQTLDDRGRGLRHLAWALTHRRDVGDDVVQDAYVLALHRERLSGDDDDRSWLRGVVRNKVRERRRSDARRVAREKRAPLHEPSPTPSETAARIETQRQVMDALSRVSEPYRTSVWLRYMAGHEPKEIAEMLGISSTTVRTRTHRGLHLLRRELDQRFEGNRAAWMGALLPLAGRHGAPAIVSTSRVAITTWLLVVGAIVTAVMGIASIARMPEANLTRQGVTHFPEIHSQRTPPTLKGMAVEHTTAAELNPRVPRVRGHVVASASPLPASVMVYAISRDAQFHTAPVTTSRIDADGRFDLSLEERAGHWLAAVSADGMWYGAVDLAAVERDTPVVIELRQPEACRMRVVDANGQSVKESLIWIEPLTDEPVRAWPRPEDDRLIPFTAVTDGEGQASVSVPTSGAYRVRVPSSFPPIERIVDSGEMSVVLKPARGTTVQISLKKRPRGDAPVEGRLICESNRRLQDRRASEQGNVFLFDHVPEGRWRFEGTSPEVRAFAHVMVGPGGEDARVESVAAINKRTNTGTMELHVFDAIGAKAPALRFFHSGVWMRRVGDKTREWRAMQPQIADGHVLRFHDLAQGIYDMYLVKNFGTKLLGGGARGTIQQEGGSTVLRIRLAPASMRTIPSLGDFRVARRELRHESLGDVPLLSDWTRRAHPRGGLPLEGTRIGPYPQGDLTLTLWNASGETKTVPLPHSSKTR